MNVEICAVLSFVSFVFLAIVLRERWKLKRLLRELKSQQSGGIYTESIRIANSLTRIADALEKPDHDYQSMDVRLDSHNARLQSLERMLRNANMF